MDIIDELFPALHKIKSRKMGAFYDKIDEIRSLEQYLARLFDVFYYCKYWSYIYLFFF